MRAKTQALTEASYKLAEAVYQQTQANQQAGPTGGGTADGGAPEEEVIEDAEIVDSDTTTRS